MHCTEKKKVPAHKQIEEKGTTHATHTHTHTAGPDGSRDGRSKLHEEEIKQEDATWGRRSREIVEVMEKNRHRRYFFAHKMVTMMMMVTMIGTGSGSSSHGY